MAMEVILSHQLSVTEATERMKKLPMELRRKYPSDVKIQYCAWSDSGGVVNLKAKGLSVKAEIKVNASQVIISGDLPFFARGFQWKVEEILRQTAEPLLKKE